jgi:hypothetical protein
MDKNNDRPPGITDDMIFNTILRNPSLALNAMTTRADLLNKLFDPRRDLDEECGYPKIITELQYRTMYDREMGRRVVNVYPEETWKVFPKIYEDPDPKKTTPFEISLDDLDKRHHILHYLQRADELSGVGHYGVILWGLNDGKELNEPVEGWEQWEEATGTPRKGKVSGPERQVIYIRVFDESLVQVATYETDVKNPRYGKPLTYNLTLSDPRNLESGAVVSPPNITKTPVHWTRITHVADNRKTSEVMGTPRMEPVWNRLYDLRKVLGGNGEMYWRGGFPGVSLETQPGLENADFDEETTREMMFNYMNGLQRYIALTGMSAKSLAPQLAEPTSSFDVQIKSICIIIGVPYRVFMGIEEGVIAGDQATKAWNGRLSNRQERYVTPMLINPALQRLVDYGVLKPPAEPQGWEVEWPDITAPSEKEKAEVATIKTEALAKYVAGSVDVLIPPMEFLTLVCGLDDETAESILGAAIEHIEGIEDDDEVVPARLPKPPELEGDGEGGGFPTKKGEEDEEE